MPCAVTYTLRCFKAADGFVGVKRGGRIDDCELARRTNDGCRRKGGGVAYSLSWMAVVV